MGFHLLIHKAVFVDLEGGIIKQCTNLWGKIVDEESTRRLVVRKDVFEELVVGLVCLFLA
jgi:hypothetical protein